MRGSSLLECCTPLAGSSLDGEDAVAVAFDLPQQNVSYHLKQPVDAGVIARERRGRYSYYSLVEGSLDHIAALVCGSPERLVAA